MYEHKMKKDVNEKKYEDGFAAVVDDDLIF
jgi:hypothetical protein